MGCCLLDLVHNLARFNTLCATVDVEVDVYGDVVADRWVGAALVG